MLDKIYLYAVGIVLVLGLVMPFDAMAGNSVLCVNGVAVYGDGTCHNASNTNNNGGLKGYTRDRYVLNGHEAMVVMMNMNDAGRISGIDGSGNLHLVGQYNGRQYPEISGRIFSCQSSPDATKFYCNSWPAM
jgi:hypothetical protein